MTSHSANRITVLAPDHVSFTVSDLEASVAFYVEAFGASELYRLGPLDAAELPTTADGRDWMEAHVGVAGARLSLAMLKLADDFKLQLVSYDKPDDRGITRPRVCDSGGHHLALRVADVDEARSKLAALGCSVQEIIAIPEGPLAGKKAVYVRDPFGNSLEIVD